MTTANVFFERLSNNLEEGEIKINRFSLIANSPLSELYRTDSYIDQIKAILQRLNGLVSAQENHKKSFPLDAEMAKDYETLMRNISAELQFLIATNNVMEDHLLEIKKTGDIQNRISGDSVELKRQINVVIWKAKKIISE